MNLILFKIEVNAPKEIYEKLSHFETNRHLMLEI